MAGISNTQRTLKYLKDKGCYTCMVERWIKIPVHPAGGVRKDMFGFGDLLAMDPNTHILWAVQSCGTAYSEHNKTITQSDIVTPLVIEWLKCKNGLVLMAWRKVKKKRGGKATTWKPRIKIYTLDDFKHITSKDTI